MATDDIFETVTEATKEIEGILEHKFGARGRGLHTKALSIRSHLGEGLLKKIQFIATIRNKLHHESDFKKDDVPLSDFLRVHKQVLGALEALDADGVSVVDDVEQYYRPMPRRGLQAWKLLPPAFALVMAGFIWLGARGRTMPSVIEPAVSRPQAAAVDVTVPLWSIEHPREKHRAFPWREEQAAFVAGGEKGTLPNETLWRVTSSAREVKTKHGRFLELDIELGGGSTRGAVRFGIGDSFDKLAVSNIPTEIEIPGGHSPREVRGAAMKADGSSFDSSGHTFQCQREIPGGCAGWTDGGVAYVAVSRVSFGNALKVAYEY